jgi:pimeloyl-ACP methyl ester carboxylesterase
MKRYFICAIILLMGISSFAQDMSGKWNGVLKVQTVSLRIAFNIKDIDGKYSTTMDSPDQGASGLPVEKTYIFGNVISLKMPNMGAEYFGVYNKDTNEIEGTFKQMGNSFKLILSRKAEVIVKTLRPQEPVEPFNYISEEVVFENKKEKISLAGTLTMPKGKGKHAVVILISGSGPQNRNEELMGHKPFLVIADYLTNHGIAVLRFDDRGVAASKGVFARATTEDFANDVEAGINYLRSRKDIDSKHIGLIGHSEGGIIAPMIAARNKDVDFIVLLAAPGLDGGKILELQTGLIAKASGLAPDAIKDAVSINNKISEIVKRETSDEKAIAEITDIVKNSMLALTKENRVSEKDVQTIAQTKAKSLITPWYRFFIKYDPTTALEKVHCPVLAMNGDKDLQVPAKENLAAIEKALLRAGNNHYICLKLKGLNHLFQTCTTGSPREYSSIEETFSEDAMQIMSKWINNTVND